MPRFEDFGVKAGIWSGRLHAETLSEKVLLTHLDRDVATAEVTPDGDGIWSVRVAVPPALLTDGVQTLLLVEDSTPRHPLASLSLVCGHVLESDLRAELGLMRAELDLLKRELRRLAAG